MTMSDTIHTIEWDMMDKRKFFPLSMLSSFTVRCCLYPLTVIKTRLQVQRHDQMYKGSKNQFSQFLFSGGEMRGQITLHFYYFSGMGDAWKKIYTMEGVGGLYRGFWISSIQIVSGVFYITTYEGVRHVLGQAGFNPRLKALAGGGAASLVGQTIIVPFDVLSQHLMVLGFTKPGVKPNPEVSMKLYLRRFSLLLILNYVLSFQMVMNPLGIALDKNNSRFRTTMDIVSAIYRRDGLTGFYRGYVASLCTYVPNSAMWWAFYHAYQGAYSIMFTHAVKWYILENNDNILNCFFFSQRNFTGSYPTMYHIY